MNNVILQIVYIMLPDRIQYHHILTAVNNVLCKNQNKKITSKTGKLYK